MTCRLLNKVKFPSWIRCFLQATSRWYDEAWDDSEHPSHYVIFNPSNNAINASRMKCPGVSIRSSLLPPPFSQAALKQPVSLALHAIPWSQCKAPLARVGCMWALGPTCVNPVGALGSKPKLSIGYG